MMRILVLLFLKSVSIIFLFSGTQAFSDEKEFDLKIKIESNAFEQGDIEYGLEEITPRSYSLLYDQIRIRQFRLVWRNVGDRNINFFYFIKK